MTVQRKNHPEYHHLIVCSNGEVFSTLSNKYLKSSMNECGYLSVGITIAEKEYRKYRVHRLVAETFLDNPYNKKEVNHKDGDKSNNNLSNLEWATSKENKSHAWSSQLYTHKGATHYLSNLSEKDVHRICELLQDGRRNKDVANTMGVGTDVITAIKTGKNWKDISKHYQFSVKRSHRKSEKDIRKICELIVQGFTNKEIEERTGTNRKEVCRIRSKSIFKSISKDYDF